jgi:MFS family permease
MGQEKTMWNKHFLVALVGYFFLFMSVTLFFIFPLFFEQFHASKTQIGLIMGIHSLTAIFMRPVFGRIIDIKGRKKISLFGIGFLIAVLPLFHFIGDAGIVPLVLRALTGIGWGISMTATVTICSDLAPVSRLAQSMGIIGVAGLLSAASGPLLAEEIVRHFGFGGLFNTSLLFLIISFACIALTKEVIKPNHNRHFHKPESMKHLALFSIFLIFLLPVFHGAIRGAVVFFIALFGKSIPLDRVGPFFVAFSAAAILTRFFLGDLSDRYGRKQILFPSICIISLNLFLISQVHSLWVFILAGFVGGFGQGLIFPALSTYVIDMLGQENKGFAISLYLTFFDVGMGFGPVLFGWISDLYGYRHMFLIAGLVFFLTGLLFTWKAPSPAKSEVE